MKFIQERTMFKLLVENTGALFSVTTRQRAYFFFLSTKMFGAKVAPTTDPYPGIVELCQYDIATIAKRWDALANVKLKTRVKLTSEVPLSTIQISDRTHSNSEDLG
jgi:hypothetical protein